MLSAAECRAKAKQALDTAATATNSRLRIYWEQTAQDWAALAATAELQEQVERDLLDGEPE
jgi:hypothetical protein